MNKYIYFLSIFFLLTGCSSKDKKQAEDSEILIKKAEAIQEETHKVDDLLKALESEFDTNQNAIDSLLNDI